MGRWRPMRGAWLALLCVFVNGNLTQKSGLAVFSKPPSLPVSEMNQRRPWEKCPIRPLLLLCLWGSWTREVKQPTPGHTASQNWFYIIISATFCEAWRCHGSKVHKRLPCRSRRGLWASAWVLESGQAIWTKTLLPLPSSCGTMGT